MIKNEHGFTLTELLAAIVLVGLLGYGFAMAMLQFVIGFNETRDYMKLQHEMMSVINCFRTGYVQKGVNTDLDMIGLMTAEKAKILPGSRGIDIYPIHPGGALQYWTRIWHELRDNSVRLTASYGHIHKPNIIVFPSDEELVGREYKFQITELRFAPINADGVILNLAVNSSEYLELVNYTITGKVRFREKSARQSVDQDKQQNVRYAKFDGIIYVGNSSKANESANN